MTPLSVDLLALARRIESLEREAASLRAQRDTLIASKAHPLDARQNDGEPAEIVLPWDDTAGGVPLQLRVVAAGAVSAGRLHVFVRAVDGNREKFALGYYADADLIAGNADPAIAEFVHRAFCSRLAGGW